MADPIKVDSHVHLYPTAEDGLADKESYQIWEYGERADMCFSDLAGTLDDAKEAMAAAGVSKAVVVNLFMGRLLREAATAELPEAGGYRRIRSGKGPCRNRCTHRRTNEDVQPLGLPGCC